VLLWGIHTYQVIVSVVAWSRGFHQMTNKNMNDQWASACLPRFPLCTRPNDTQDAVAGYQKERKHGHHCNLMIIIIIIIIRKLTSQKTHFESNQNGM